MNFSIFFMKYTACHRFRVGEGASKRLLFKIEYREAQERAPQLQRLETPEIRERNGRNRIRQSYQESEASIARIENENEKMKLRQERDEALQEVQKLREEMQRKVKSSFQKGKKSERWGNRIAWLRKQTLGRVEDRYELNYSAKEKLFKKMFKKKKNETWSEYAKEWLQARKSNQEKTQWQNEKIGLMTKLMNQAKEKREQQIGGELKSPKKVQGIVDKLKQRIQQQKEQKQKVKNTKKLQLTPELREQLGRALAKKSPEDSLARKQNNNKAA